MTDSRSRSLGYDRPDRADRLRREGSKGELGKKKVKSKIFGGKSE